MQRTTLHIQTKAIPSILMTLMLICITNNTILGQSSTSTNPSDMIELSMDDLNIDADMDDPNKYMTMSNASGVNILENYAGRGEYRFEGKEMIYKLPKMEGDYFFYTDGRKPDSEVDLFLLTDPTDAQSSVMWMNGTGVKQHYNLKSEENYYVVIDGFMGAQARVNFAMSAAILMSECTTSGPIDLNNLLTMGEGENTTDWIRIDGEGGILTDNIFTPDCNTTTSVFKAIKDFSTKEFVTTEDVTIVFNTCNPTVEPIFDPIASFCKGDDPLMLPTMSTNNVSGTWNPATITTDVAGTFDYSFTPDGNQNACLITIQLVIMECFIDAGVKETWTVPPNVCQITIKARGADGGNEINRGRSGGAGATMEATFAVVPGQVLNIMVGQKGGTGDFGGAGGGGGGTGVQNNCNDNILLIAGGGGGASTSGRGNGGSAGEGGGDGNGGAGDGGNGGSAGGGGAGGTGPGAGGFPGRGGEEGGGNGTGDSGGGGGGGVGQAGAGFCGTGGARGGTRGGAGGDGAGAGGGGGGEDDKEGGGGGGGGYSGGGGGGAGGGGGGGSFVATSRLFTGIMIEGGNANGRNGLVTISFSAEENCNLTTDAVCSGNLGTTISDWQTAIEAKNIGMPVLYSTIGTPPNGMIATGTVFPDNNCFAETQYTFAYLQCKDDRYLLLGEHRLTVFPEVQAPTITKDKYCVITVEGVCGRDRITLSGGQGTIENNNTDSVTYIPLAGETGDITIRVSGGFASPCTAYMSTTSIPITPKAAPEDTEVCAGSMVTINGMGTGTGTLTHEWSITSPLEGASLSGPTSNSSVTVDAGTTTGTLTLSYTVTDSEGCDDTKTVDVTILPLPTAAPIANKVCTGGTVIIDGNTTGGTGDLTHAWTINSAVTGTSISNETDQKVTVDAGTTPGTLNLKYTVTDSKGCTDTKFVNVSVEDCINDMSLSVSDPCLCANTNNLFLADGTVLFEDKLLIDLSSFPSGLTPTITVVDGNLLTATGPTTNATATAFTATTATNAIVDIGSDMFELQFYTLPGMPSTLTVNAGGDTETFITASCEQCLIPTISEWGLIICGLLMLIFGVVAIKEKEFLVGRA